MYNVLGLTYDELSQIIKESGLPAYRAEQIYSSAMRNVALCDITTLSNALRSSLTETLQTNAVTISNCLTSKIDGTKKYLYKLADGNLVEGVLMSYKYGNTLCISTQVGCRMGCAFCASGIGGLVRNMTADEIVGEVVAVNATIECEHGKRGVTNVVLMGTGEPLDNLDNVMKFVSVISDSHGLNISPRNISISTSGLVDGIKRLAELNTDINLTISLHNPFDDERSLIMPVNKAHNVSALLGAVRDYFNVTKRRIYFEYCLIKGVNDSPRHATELCRLLRGFPCHVNLIRLNYVKEKKLHSSESDTIKAFMDILEKGNISCTLRRNMGSDINGACGQLRRQAAEEE